MCRLLSLYTHQIVQPKNLYQERMVQTRRLVTHLLGFLVNFAESFQKQYRVPKKFDVGLQGLLINYYYVIKSSFTASNVIITTQLKTVL